MAGNKILQSFIFCRTCILV